MGKDDIRAIRLRKAVEDSPYTQTEICDKTGINKGSLSSYMSGRYFPKQHNLDLLANALNVSITYLMGFSEDQEDETLLYNQITYKKRPCDNIIPIIDDLSEDEVKQVINYILFVKSQR